MNFDPQKPFNDLPPLPPRADIETRPILKSCIAAHAALAELRQAGNLIPNPSVLINTIPLLEARDSSEIENIVTTTDALFRQASLNEKNADPATKEALRYRTALRRGFDSILRQPLSTNTAIEICRIIKDTQIAIRNTPGTKLANPATGAVIYTPPEGETVIREKLANWERFLHEQQEIDPLVRLAVQHYQFEAIHPFADGNGRTGRVLNILFLIQTGLLETPILYLSRAILQTRRDYYRLLLQVTREGAWEPWIAYMLRCIEETARWTTQKIHAVRRLMAHTADHVRLAAPTSYSHELVELIFALPYVRIANLVEAGLAERHRAGYHLRELARVGVLREIRAGRQKLFFHPKYFALLTSDEHDFAPYDMPEEPAPKERKGQRRWRKAHAE